jgi:ArsR family transcriptional regulator, arsenate/arsenite/antimonite-responsive transcriptional repressor
MVLGKIQNPKSKMELLETLITASPQIIAGFHALSEPIRIQTIELLRSRELCVCDLCELLALNQSKLSFHLKVLKTADLVHTRQEGKWIYYRLNLAQFAILENYLSDYRKQIASLPTRICC